MNVMRILVLVIALGAAGMAALLLGGFFGKSKEAVASPGPVGDLTEVLVAATDIDVGHRLTAEDLKWQKWPKDGVAANFISKEANPSGLETMIGAVARTVLFSGEPATEGKLVHAESASFMAATLSPGMRAVSVEISEGTAAGGFILPNDRVDVIISATENTDESGNQRAFTRTLLENIRVLAVGQTFRDNTASATPEDSTTTVEKANTATLEVSPVEAELLEHGAKAGKLSLALRGLADADKPIVELRVPAGQGNASRANNTITIIRYGTASQVQAAGNQ